jgi:endonuclease-3
MATTINKQRVLNQVFTSAAKHAEPEPEPRPVLQQFIYGLCRENATPEQAEQAYQNLCERFFDWNEVRVSSVREIEDALRGLSGAESRAQRLISFLQEVFETEFSYDLEGLHKQGLKQAAKKLSRYAASDDYLVAWVIQRSLAGHAIPVDPPTLRCAQRLGLVEGSQEDVEAARASLEHLVPKSKGPLFTDVISNLSEEYCWEDEPNCAACPMNSECPTAQDAGVESLVVGRGHRPKPR